MNSIIDISYLVSAVCFIYGLKMLRHPKTARNGNIIASEKIIDLKNKTIKKYEINFDKSPEKLQISKIKGVSNLNIDINIVTFSMQGNIDNLIKSLAKFKVNNLRITEPDLEEIFLTYY